MPRRLTKEEFIERAKLTHGDKYDYNLVEYKNNRTKVKIKCDEHGIFLTKPNTLLSGSRCPTCGREHSAKIRAKLQKKSTEQFIEEVEKALGNTFDYSKVNYINNKTNIEIICKRHGSFWQRPDHHVKDFCGCPKCNASGPEQVIINYLDSNNINYEFQKTFKKCKFIKELPFDFYIPDANLLIEYQDEQHYKKMRFEGSDLTRRQKYDKIKKILRCPMGLIFWKFHIGIIKIC